VVNLFAWRATSPDDMKSADDPVGPENDHWIRRTMLGADCVVCAWGKHGSHAGRAKAFLKLSPLRALHVLALNKDGSPKHPLYVRGDTQPQPWLI
jgi:hypothetical protein